MLKNIIQPGMRLERRWRSCGPLETSCACSLVLVSPGGREITTIATAAESEARYYLWLANANAKRRRQRS